jgi:hypothetical protein
MGSSQLGLVARYMWLISLSRDMGLSLCLVHYIVFLPVEDYDVKFTYKAYMCHTIIQPVPNVLYNITVHCSSGFTYNYYRFSLPLKMSQSSHLACFGIECWILDVVLICWLFIFRGYAHSHTVTGADPQTTYKYRIRFMTNNENTEWSPHLTVSTTSKCVYGLF